MRRNVVLVLVALGVLCLLALLDLAGSASATGTGRRAPENSSQVDRQLENDGARILPARFGDLRIDSGTYLQLRNQHTDL